MAGATGPRWFEVDAPRTQAFKREVLVRAGIDTTGVTYVPADFMHEDWFENVAGAGFDPRRPSLFLWELVTMYLDRDAVLSTLRRIAGTAPGSALAFDYMSTSMIESGLPFMRYARAVVVYTGEPLRFGTDTTPPAAGRIAAFLEPCGLRLVEHRTFGAESPGRPAWAGFAIATAGAATGRLTGTDPGEEGVRCAGWGCCSTSVVLLSPLPLSALPAAAPASAASGAAAIARVGKAHCQPGDRVETGLQGQVPMADRDSGRAAQGYNCNLTLIGGLAGHSFANFDTYLELRVLLGQHRRVRHPRRLRHRRPRRLRPAPPGADRSPDRAGDARRRRSRCGSTRGAGCSSPTTTGTARGPGTAPARPIRGSASTTSPRTAAIPACSPTSRCRTRAATRAGSRPTG